MTIEWDMLNALVQWVIIPALIWLWSHEKRINNADRETMRMLTIIEEREKARQNLRVVENETLADLHKAIKDYWEKHGEKTD